MATWEQPPKSVWDLLKDYLNQTYGESGYSASCDSGRRLINLDIPSLDDNEMNFVILELKNKFPGAF